MNSLLHLDWLSITIPLSDKGERESLSDLQWWTQRGARIYTCDKSKWRVSGTMFGYTHAYTSSMGVIAMFGNIEMGLHVIYSGQALQNLQSVGIDSEEIIKNACVMGAKSTRADIALDIINGTAKVADFQRVLRTGEARTSSKSWRVLESGDGGHTLYIGSRSSERMVRVYDKKAERASKFEEVSAAGWIRVEAELKGEQSKNFLKACRDNELPDVMNSFLIAAIDFPTIKDYQEATRIGNSWVEPTITKRKDTKTRHWLMSTIAPVLAKETAQDSEFWAQFMIEVNALREKWLKDNE